MSFFQLLGFVYRDPSDPALPPPRLGVLPTGTVREPCPRGREEVSPNRYHKWLLLHLTPVGKSSIPEPSEGWIPLFHQ